MALTPDDVINKSFTPTKFREGYDQIEVDDFLDEVVAELRRLGEENDELRNKLAAAEHRVGELSRGDLPSQAEPRAAEEAPAAPEPAPVAAAPAQAAPAPTEAAGMLALAQRLHDEYVRNGEQERDNLIGEARTRAERIVAEAEEHQRETLGSLERERVGLERTIEELRGFERDYRSRLRAYLEGQLHDLDAHAEIVPGSDGTARQH